MFQINQKDISSNISRFRIIIEETGNYDVSGILYNDYYGVAIDFHGIRHMLSYLDDFFDYVNFPQATHEKRSFREETGRKRKNPLHGIREVSPEEMRDKQTTFLLHVQFRQNSTWQGTLEWIPERATKRFRSELELIGLIVEALKNSDNL